MSGDYLVCCMSAVMLRRIPITPALSDKKRCYRDVRVLLEHAVFQSATGFGEEQNAKYED